MTLILETLKSRILFIKMVIQVHFFPVHAYLKKNKYELTI